MRGAPRVFWSNLTVGTAMTRMDVRQWRPMAVAAALTLVGVTSCTTSVCGCSDPSPFTPSIVSGDGQEAGPGEALTDSIVVLVTRNATGLPEAGLLVQFFPQDGSTSPVQVVTDSAGLAASEWTVGIGPGTDTLYVQAESSPAVRFIATVR